MSRFVHRLAAAAVAVTGTVLIGAATSTGAEAAGGHGLRTYATLPNGQVLQRKPGGHRVVDGRKPGGHAHVNGHRPGGHNVAKIDTSNGARLRFVSLADARAGKGVGGLRLETRKSPSGMSFTKFRCEWEGAPCPFGYSTYR